MSTSLLYYAFGIRGYDHINTKFAGGAGIGSAANITIRVPLPILRGRHQALTV